MKPDIGAYVNPEYSEQLMRLNSVSANVRAEQSGTDYILFFYGNEHRLCKMCRTCHEGESSLGSWLNFYRKKKEKNCGLGWGCHMKSFLINNKYSNLKPYQFQAEINIFLLIPTDALNCICVMWESKASEGQHGLTVNLPDWIMKLRRIVFPVSITFSRNILFSSVCILQLLIFKLGDACKMCSHLLW